MEDGEENRKRRKQRRKRSRGELEKVKEKIEGRKGRAEVRKRGEGELGGERGKGGNMRNKSLANFVNKHGSNKKQKVSSEVVGERLNNGEKDNGITERQKKNKKREGL